MIIFLIISLLHIFIGTPIATTTSSYAELRTYEDYQREAHFVSYS